VTTAQAIIQAPSSDFVWWCLVAVAAAVGGFIASFVFLARTRLMENMPTSRLRSAAQGYVELEGESRVLDGPPIIAPLTKSRCVWWRFCIERLEGSGKNRRWVTVSSGTSDDSFEMIDATGRCVVDPDSANVIPAKRHRWYGSTATPHVGPELGSGWLRALFSRYRYTEELLLPGGPLYALGAFRTQGGGPDSFDEQVDVKDLLAKWKHDPKMMSMLDVNKDGAIDMKEWEAARRMALSKVRAEHVERAVSTPDLNILAKPRDGRPYILSAMPQARLIARYRAYAAGCFGGMTLAAGFLAWALTLRGVL
jgi:hypothetical protein